jgi:sulfur carrier protein ThiS
MEISLQCFSNLTEEGVCDHRGAIRHEIVEGENIKCLITRLGIPDNEIQTAFLNGRAVDLKTALHNRDRLTLVPAVGAA